MNHSKGLSFKKLDLHLHTPASACFRDKNITAQQIVGAAQAQGLAGIAITDHNSGMWIDLVKEAARDLPLVIFPGVEITCQGGKGGLHIIALFDPSTGRVEVEGLLGELKLEPKDFGRQDALVKESFDTVLTAINRRGGVAVLAHANSTHGGLADMTGRQRIELINHDSLAAAEATDFLDAEKKGRKKRVVDLLDGSDASFRKLAVYQASDNQLADGSGEHGLEGIGKRCSYFKLDKLNLEGLRQCLHDPDVRIRQDHEYTKLTYPYISSITVTSGFLDGATAEFHQGLNSILGGKGTGKSLLIELMRFGLGQPPDSDDIRADHDQKLQERLKEFGSVEVVVLDETGKEIRVKRTFIDSENSPFDDPVHEEIARLFPVLFLSQTEIIRIAEDRESQIEFIDRFFDFRSYTSRITQLEHDLGLLDKRYADSLRARSEVTALTKTLTSSSSELSRLDAALKNPVFEELRSLEIKDMAFKEQIAKITEFIRLLIETQDAIKESPKIDIPTTLSKDAALLRVQKATDDANQNLLTQLETTISSLRKSEQSIQSEYGTWKPEFDAARKKYEAVVQKEGGDYKKLAARRDKVVKECDTINRRLESVRQRATRLRIVADERKGRLAQLREIYSEYSEERRAKCEKFERESSGRLKVKLHEASDRDAFKAELLSLKKGSYLRDAEVEAICGNIDPSAFVHAIIVYSVDQKVSLLNDIAKAASIEIDRMKTLVEYLLNSLELEDILRLQYSAMPEDRPEIEFLLGDNIYESINRLSIGQKCTAMLIMALSDGTIPVVIDQPEDSLDIRSVWDDMCSKIRSGKEHRQFVFTTHNSSLAVASDSDKFIILEGGASKGRVVFSGSMDHGPISDEVMKYLEGGPDTYKMKFLKYDAKKKIK